MASVMTSASTVDIFDSVICVDFAARIQRHKYMCASGAVITHAATRVQAHLPAPW